MVSAVTDARHPPTPITTSLLYIYPNDWTDADLVRHLWHFRLIQPEWVGSPPQYDYLRWTQAETLARLGAVFLGWMGSVSWMLWRHAPGRTITRPARRLHLTAATRRA